MWRWRWTKSEGIPAPDSSVAGDGAVSAEEKVGRRHHRGREERSEKKAERRDARRKMLRQRRLTGRIRSVRDHGQPPARDRTRHDGVLQRFREARDERREIGDRGVVVERRQRHRPEEERKLRKPPEDRRDPPLLERAVNDEPGEEEPDEKRRPEIRRVLVRRRGLLETRGRSGSSR